MPVEGVKGVPEIYGRRISVAYDADGRKLTKRDPKWDSVPLDFLEDMDVEGVISVVRCGDGNMDWRVWILGEYHEQVMRLESLRTLTDDERCVADARYPGYLEAWREKAETSGNELEKEGD